jgi:hypothetical protein
VLCVLLFAPLASAHVVHIDWKLTETNLVVVAYFDNDIPADDAEVSLTAADGSVVASGKTDDTGTWRGPKPAPGTYRLSIHAFTGHDKTVSIEVPGAAAPASEEAASSGNKWLLIGTGATMTAVGVVAILLLWWRRRRRGEPPFAE